MSSLIGHLLRRTAVTLAIVQLAMVVAVPVHAAPVVEHGPTSSIEARHHHPSIPSHDAEHCPICQLQSAQFAAVDAPRAPLPAVATVAPRAASFTLPVSRPPPAAHPTRAPPRDLA
jgi:hypothetical protein